MDNALKWIEGNPALLLGLITVLLILNLLVIFILASRFADLRREIKGLGFGSNGSHDRQWFGSERDPTIATDVYFKLNKSRPPGLFVDRKSNSNDQSGHSTFSNTIRSWYG